MPSSDITILAFLDRIALFHTLLPLYTGAVSKGFRDRGIVPPRFTVTGNPTWCLNRDTNRVLVIVRMFLKPPVTDEGLLCRLRSKYDRIIFMNGNAGGAIHRPEVLPYVDRFYNKAVLADPDLYTRELYGTELFSDYYHREYGIDDGAMEWNRPAAPAAALEKIRNHWNIGIGAFPRRHFPQRVGVALARLGLPGLIPRFFSTRSSLSVPIFDTPLPEEAFRYDINLRIGNPGYPSIAFHRQYLSTIIREAAERRGWSVATDRVPVKRFFRDLQRSRITFSPFGWGELCFRDFEAVRAGSLLVKPDMGHLRTYPNIFIPHETYVPLAWDGSDLEENMQHYLQDQQERERIIRNAAEQFRQELRRLPDAAYAVFADALGEEYHE